MPKKGENASDKILRLHKDKNSTKDLQAFVDKLNSDALEAVVSDLKTSKGCELLDALLSVYGSDARYSGKHFELITRTLEVLRREPMPSLTFQDMLSSITLEFQQLTSEQLVQITEKCIETISQKTDIHYCWKDVLPECFKLLLSRTTPINYCDTVVPSSEFVSRCLRSLFQQKWSPSIVTPLTAMFLEINLSKEEHSELINKLCCDLEQLRPESVPPLMHQLLKLCKDNHGPMVYFRISDYFHSRMYSMIYQESESPQIDYDSIELSLAVSADKAEATCLYHACEGGNALKKLLTTLKGLSRKPSVLLSSPTLIQILLSVERQQETCTQIIRSYFYYHLYEELRRSEYIWCRDALKTNVNVSILINTLVENSIKHCPITGDGLLHLAMSFIGTGGLFPIVGDMQELGTLLLIKLIKRKPQAFQPALKMLRDKLSSDSANIPSIANSIKALCRMPLSMMECIVTLQSIMEDCFFLPEGRNWTDHCLIIESFGNMMQHNVRLRDNFVLVCRKGLLSRDPKISQLAICGFLYLIKSLRTNADTFSQTNTSSISVLTQIVMSGSSQTSKTSRVNNNMICSEIILLMRRCFVHNIEVREQFYLGLNEAISGRSELLEQFFDLLYEHLDTKYYKSDSDTLPPLDLKSCLLFTDGDVALQEPLGRLLFTIQQLLVCEPPNSKSNGWTVNDEFYGTGKELNTIMTSLAERLAKCTPVHFNEDNGISLNDIGVESKEKCLILQQAILCYESIMAFVINEWTPTKTDQPIKLLNLFKIYSQLLDFGKTNSSKSKKDAAKASQKSPDDDAKGTQPKRARKQVMRFADMAKNRNVFKLPTTVWDIYSISHAFDLLYSDSIDWSSKDQWEQVRTKRELHRTVARLCIGVIKNLKAKQPNSYEKKYIYKSIECLFVNCISKLNDLSCFDEETALLIVECYHGFIQLAINKKFKLPEILINAGNFNPGLKVKEMISDLTEKLGVQFELALVDPSVEMSPFSLKLVPALFNLISDLLSHIQPGDPICEKWIEWLLKMASKKHGDKNLASPIVSTLLTLSAKSSDPWSVCNTLVDKLKTIMDTIENKENESRPSDNGDFKSINEANASNCFVSICNHLNSRFAAVDIVVGRIRADAAYLQYRKTAQLVTAQASLKDREQAVCAELCSAAHVIQELSSISIPAGPCCDSILRIMSRLHGNMSTLTAHFCARDARSIHSARFEKLVKFCGKKMAQTINSLISYIEGIRKENTETGTKARAKLIKDTKLIPPLVYACELFYKKVHQLSTKSKIDFDCYLPMGNARDFRINSSSVKESLKNVDDSTEMDVDANDEATCEDETQVTEENEGTDAENSASEEEDN